MTWWTFAVRIFVSAALGWMTFALLCKGATAGRYSAALVGLAFFSVLWIADLEGASRIVVAGFEIDRRVQVAEDVITRLQAVERVARDSAEQLHALIGSGERTAAEVNRVRDDIARVGRIVIKAAFVVADGSSRFDGPPEGHLRELETYTKEFEAITGQQGEDLQSEIASTLKRLNPTPGVPSP